MAFPSVYEMTNPLTTVRKQHFWEYFSGANITAPTTTATYAPTSGLTDTDIGTVFMAGEGVITTSSALYNKYVIEANFMVFKTSGTTGTITAVQVDENGDVVHEFWSKNIADLGTSNYVMSNEVSIPSPIQMKQWHTLGIISTHDVKFGIKISEAWDGTNSGRVYYSNYNTLGSTSNSPTRGYNTNYDMAFLFKLSSTPIGDRWTERNVTGTGTFAMVDAVDSGYSITSGGTSGDSSDIDFNNKRQHAHNASIFLGVWLRSTANTFSAFGGVSDMTSSDLEFAKLSNDTAFTNISVRTGDASTASSTESDIAVDTSWHIGKVECGSADIKGYIDGVLKVTKTTNRPTVKLQPFFHVYTRATGAAEGKIKYFEAYNT